jgi:molecular chaperone DnaK
VAVIGIDLGTTNTVMAVIENGRAVAIPNAEGALSTPSVVAFNAEIDEMLVGAAAKRQAVLNPAHTIFSIKRFMGREFNDPALTMDKRFIPYELQALQHGRNILVQLGEKWCAPHDIAGLILKKLKCDAERYLNEPVTGAVITVPAYYDHVQRHAVRQAGENAKLKVVRVVNEPTAAALAYGIRREDNHKLVVCHLGGGTFDVSIVEVGESVIEVKATSGDAHLGGDDFDWLVMEWIFDTFKAQTGIDLTQDRVARARLREAVEAAKCRLSTVQETKIHVPHIAPWTDTVHSIDLVLTRAQLESLTQSLLARLKPPCKQVLDDMHLKWEKIDEVILIGQQSQMPAVQRIIGEVLGKTPRLALDNVQGVALGAAIQAGTLNRSLPDPIPLLIDVTPFPIGFARTDGRMQVLVPRNTPIPCRKNDHLTTAEDAQTAVDVHIYRGDRPLAKDNTPLGQLHLDKIIPAPKGTPKIHVGVDIDTDGVMMVTLQDRGTGRARCWEFGHDATFHLLKDTPAFIDASVPGQYSPRPSQTTKPQLNTEHPQPVTKPPSNVAHSAQKASSAPRVVFSPPETASPSPAVIEAAQAAVRCAETLLRDFVPSDALPLQHLLWTYVSSVSQALEEQAGAVIKIQTQALQTLLDSLEALNTGDPRQAVDGLTNLIVAENNPQARADLAYVLRQIGRDDVT